MFKLPAWQVIFFTGIAVGYHRQAVERFILGLPRHLAAAAFALACAVVVGLYTVQATNLEALQLNSVLYELGFDKPNVPVLRLLVLALLSVAAFGLATLFWRPVRAVTGWLLLPLGQHALTAYSLHLGVVVGTSWLWVRGFIDLHHPPTASAFQVAGVLFVWLLIVSQQALRARLEREAPASSGAQEQEQATQLSQKTAEAA